MAIKIALAGNPNSGKTTLFNDLTGSSQYVGNWPGVTVEKKEGRLRGHKDVTIIDLPGIYSLSPYTMEEVVSRDYLINEKPDVIINTVDASNIERNLYLTTQLLEMGIPVVIALNMIDIVQKNGDEIDTVKLSKDIGCHVVEMSALKSFGTKEAAEKAMEVAQNKVSIIPQHSFDKGVEQALSSISNILANKVDTARLRWLSIKLFERDEKILEKTNLGSNLRVKLEEIIVKCENDFDDDSESIITNERYTYIGKVVLNSVKKKNTTKLTLSDKIDKIVTNRILALPIFVVIMFMIYYLSITTIGGQATDWVTDEFFGVIVPDVVEGYLESVGAAEWLTSLIVDGVISGVGAVLGFLPQMLVLFFCLAILEDCGYMTRIAFIMDRIFRKFGLSGKSFIPILIGTGCGVPGIMASRTIENENDRKMTIITTTFIPCSAKLPIIALISGSLFPDSIWVAPSAYFLGISAIVLSGIILKKTKAFSGDPSPFVMELPTYRMPALKGVLIQVWDKGKSFIKKAGTIIFLACSIIWFLSSFNWAIQMVDAEDSMLASLGSRIAPIFSPLGWGDWKSAVAALTGLVAKENIVGTLGVLHGFGEVSEDGIEMWSSLQNSFTPLAAYSFLVFNLLCAPCVAAIGAISKEMNNPRWTFIAVGYQTGLAYLVSLVIYQIGMIISGNGITILSIIAFLLVLVFLIQLLKPAKFN